MLRQWRTICVNGFSYYVWCGVSSVISVCCLKNRKQNMFSHFSGIWRELNMHKFTLNLWHGRVFIWYLQKHSPYTCYIGLNMFYLWSFIDWQGITYHVGLFIFRGLRNSIGLCTFSHNYVGIFTSEVFDTQNKLIGPNTLQKIQLQLQPRNFLGTSY